MCESSLRLRSERRQHSDLAICAACALLRASCLRYSGTIKTHAQVVACLTPSSIELDMTCVVGLALSTLAAALG